MSRGFVNLKSGQFNKVKSTYIHDDKSLVDLIEDKMGSDVADLVKELVAKSGEAYVERDSDFKYYEGRVDELAGAMNDILNEALDLQLYVEETNRLDRKKLVDKADAIGKICNNHI